jgi:hypothetical protein
MKVYIGPYLDWWGPYQIADLLRYVGVSEERCNVIGERLASTRLRGLCEWIWERRKRKVRVRIDPYDVYSMDSTLALIILPMLRMLKDNKNGAPYTDDEDAPEHLRSTTPREPDWGTDSNIHKRWDWIMGEMVFAFEEVVKDDVEYDQAVADRVNNGLRLFGKYYQALWD